MNLKIFFTFILFFANISMSADLSKDHSKKYIVMLENFKKIDATNVEKNLASIVDDIDQFSEIKKLRPVDSPLVMQILKTLVLADLYDPGHAIPETLTESYMNNKVIYKKCFEQLTAPEKKIISEIFRMLEILNKSGQG